MSINLMFEPFTEHPKLRQERSNAKVLRRSHPGMKHGERLVHRIDGRDHYK